MWTRSRERGREEGKRRRDSVARVFPPSASPPPPTSNSAYKSSFPCRKQTTAGCPTFCRDPASYWYRPPTPTHKSGWEGDPSLCSPPATLCSKEETLYLTVFLRRPRGIERSLVRGDMVPMWSSEQDCRVNCMGSLNSNHLFPSYHQCCPYGTNASWNPWVERKKVFEVKATDFPALCSFLTSCFYSLEVLSDVCSELSLCRETYFFLVCLCLVISVCNSLNWRQLKVLYFLWSSVLQANLSWSQGL